ncbi:2-deoxy-D-gluconate 3-dehydrogenase [Magnetovibrio blakemorei]|uniref:2-deoxy-D-gluconate 3-dehydrogenase n=2 Tax=Magnetovibrio blakemorei TaxID=28181 RepID=A0A1E5Q325_9PROT|nr:2-deoxy-D-gluconate 3-dehydrogenase [Magnetovibrio blakemorei]
MFSLEGRVAIVTGASRGIGWALADGLARSGSKVLALARSKAADQCFLDLVEYQSCDVTNTEALTHHIDTFVENCGRIDVLINAAGISLPGDIQDGVEHTIKVNLIAPYRGIEAVARHMRAARSGSIINVTSLAAFQGFPNNPGYAAAKGGLSQLTRAMACDLGPFGVRVNNLVPGYIETDMTAASYKDQKINEQRCRNTMLERWGAPSDLVGAAVFLASDASSYMTGQDIVVDGGWLAKGLV